ncbi:MAG: hypothetical protein CM15mP74_16560 [Halieaceae bacterium]|nr:MAG: hypothetical protein CM15mP74_16560 [Halieaceae bacterium]
MSGEGYCRDQCPGLNSGDVADLAVTMLTSLLLGIPKSQNYILEDRWTALRGSLSLRNMPVGMWVWARSGGIAPALIPLRRRSQMVGSTSEARCDYPMLRRCQISLINAAA